MSDTYDENGACERLRLAMLFIEEWANWWSYSLGVDDDKPMSDEERAAGEKMAESFGTRAADMVIMNRRFLASQPSVRSAIGLTTAEKLRSAANDLADKYPADARQLRDLANAL